LTLKTLDKINLLKHILYFFKEDIDN